MSEVFLTGVERFFDKNKVIVSKTDLKGRITYANRVFMDVAGYTEDELIGQPHSLVRHPDMPRCAFKLLWDELALGHEVFAYVVNRAKNGDHYWVLAHVTPAVSADGTVFGYHSTRRVPSRSILDGTIIPLYAALLAEEKRHANQKDGMMASFQMLVDILKSKGVSYDQLIFALSANAA
jgi:PAS domain S-box-containing protein